MGTMFSYKRKGELLAIEQQMIKNKNKMKINKYIKILLNYF